MTPTEDLIMEVLVARWRLGERLWTFPRNAAVTRAARKLEKRGLIVVQHGQVEYTFRASLTEKGREEHSDSSYIPPILRNDQCRNC